MYPRGIFIPLSLQYNKVKSKSQFLDELSRLFCNTIPRKHIHRGTCGSVQLGLNKNTSYSTPNMQLTNIQKHTNTLHCIRNYQDTICMSHKILLNDDIRLCITVEEACITTDINTKIQINSPHIKGTAFISLSDPLQKVQNYQDISLNTLAWNSESCLATAEGLQRINLT